MLTTSTRSPISWYHAGPPPVSMTFLLPPDWVMSNTVPATARLPVRQVFTRPIAAFTLHLRD